MRNRLRFHIVLNASTKAKAERLVRRLASNWRDEYVILTLNNLEHGEGYDAWLEFDLSHLSAKEAVAASLELAGSLSIRWTITVPRIDNSGVLDFHGSAKQTDVRQPGLVHADFYVQNHWYGDGSSMP